MGRQLKVGVLGQAPDDQVDDPGADKRVITWLNMISDQAVGLAGKVVSGTPRDTLHLVDLVYNADGGRRPEVLITDQGSYSDIVFAIVTLLGFDYRPVLADLPDTRLWRIDRSADYGRLDCAARGTIDLEAVRRHWPDILRVVGSIHTGQICAHDVIRILQRDGRPTQLGDAMAVYGRIFKTLHVLTFADDPDYRRQLKGMRKLQKGRHDLARPGTSSTAAAVNCTALTTPGWKAPSAPWDWS